jgi:hypothetical protein
MSRNSNHDLLNFTILPESEVSTISADKTTPSPSLVRRGSKKSIFAQTFNFLPG